MSGSYAVQSTTYSQDFDQWFPLADMISGDTSTAPTYWGYRLYLQQVTSGAPVQSWRVHVRILFEFKEKNDLFYT